jgi:hypothetical protein
VQMNTPSILSLIQQVVVSLMAAAVAVFLATWSRSPIRLPLPNGLLNRWLRVIPVLAASVIIGILSTWFTDCSYLSLLFVLSLIAFILCVGLMVTHHHILQKMPDANTLLVIVCFGWSILGILCVSSTATMIIAKQQMEDTYKKNPLTLWQIVGRHKQKPEDAIYLTAGLPAHFKAEMDECHNTTPEMSLFPSIGQLINGSYTAPKSIEKQQQVTIRAQSLTHHDTQDATIILLPDPPNIKRVQYPGKDSQNREAVFDFIIISKNDSWVYGSEELVEKNRLDTSEELRNTAQRTPVCKPIMELAGSHAFEPYVDVISIGTASREGTEAEETNRAGRRSQRIAEWVNLALRDTGLLKNVYTMNLGQYHPGTDDKALTKYDTAPERPVILIGIVREGDINLEEALRNVFEQHQENEFFKFLATHYPRREINLYSGFPKTTCHTQ